MSWFRFLLYPLAIVYGSILAIRNVLYDIGIFRSLKFKIPVICVGNLTVGGTGKTPQIEYLIRLLNDRFPVATLSRGYGRSTSGFIYVTDQSLSTEVGDEPRQFRHKFPSMPVAVDGNRINGIKKLIRDSPSLRAVLLDDAFQHRAVKPGISILLTQFGSLYKKDLVVPAGSLREFSSGSRRADIIIVTKCPENLSPIEKRCITRDLRPLPYQKVYFTKIIYGELIPLLARPQRKINPETHVFLLTGIANATPLLEFLSKKTKNITSLEYGDHHEYSIVELVNLQQQYESDSNKDKLIITTEKDAMRMSKPGLLEVVKDLPLFFIPVETGFLFDETESFNKNIVDYVKIPV